VPTPPGPAADPRGDGFVVNDIQLPDPAVPAPADPLGLKRDGMPPAATDPTAVTAAAFNPIDGRLYFVVVGGGPTKFNELYSVFIDPNTGAASDLEKSKGQFGAIAGTQASGGSAAVPPTTVQVSAITFHQTSARTADMFTFEVVTEPQLPSASNPTGSAGTPTGFLDTYAFNAAGGPTGFNVGGFGGRLVDVLNAGINETTQITGLAFENDQPDVPPVDIFASSSALGPAAGGGGSSGTAGGAFLFRINLTQPTVVTFAGQTFQADPAIEIANLPNPVGAFGTTSILGNDIQDLVWEPTAIDPITGDLGAFVGTDATANELAVISSSPRPEGEYLYSIFVAQGGLTDSIISISSPSDSEYDVTTGIPAPGAPSGAAAPYAGSSGDVLVGATGINTADGFSRAPLGSGYAYLGLKGPELQPIVDATTVGLGIIPAGDLQAGFATAPGVDIDEFLFGGTVTGNVDFGGNAYAFYSGWLISGNTQGITGTSIIETINPDPVLGIPTSGAYTLVVTTATGTFVTSPPPNLTFDAPASDLQTALQNALNQFGANVVQVTGPNGGPYLIQFAVSIGEVVLSIGQTSLAPAGDPPISFTEVTPPAGLESSDDLRNVWVQTDAGGEPAPGFVADAAFNTTDINGDFNSNLEPEIGGHIDQFRVVDNLQGAVTVANDAQGFGINDETDPSTGEAFVQKKLLSYLRPDGVIFGTAFFSGGIPEPANLFNDSFATPQYLGALSTSNPVITLNGTLIGNTPVAADTGDNVNFYAVALRAGQTITVQLDSEDELALGVYDPDDRLVATDYHVDKGSGVFGSATEDQPFQYTATMPGTYRFAVNVEDDDPTFSGLTEAGNDAFTLRIGDANNQASGAILPVNGKPGDISLGGLYVGSLSPGTVTTANADGSINESTGVSSVEVLTGDIGAIHADGSITNTEVIADTGNLNDLDASDLGVRVAGGSVAAGFNFADPVTISVPVGGIGLMRTTDATTTTGAMFVEPLNPDPDVLDPITHSDMTPEGLIYVGEPVGTTIQVVDAASTLACDLSVNIAFGTIQSADQDVDPANTFAVNPNNNPAIAGRIDLIDCAGNFGDFSAGGPAITTGPNGDVRYINVGGQVFEDLFFGSGTPAETIHAPGQAVTLNDDSGAVLTFTPQGTFTANPAYNASAPAAGVSAMLGPQLELTTYGIRGSGGVVVINATVTDDGSLSITSAGSAQSLTAEVTNIVLENEGPQIIPMSTAPTTITNASTGAVSNVSNSTISSPVLSTTAPSAGNTSPDSNIVPFELDPASAASMTVSVTGTNNVDIWDITGFTDPTHTTLASFTSIINYTAGEIDNVNAESIGVLKSGGPIGVPTTSTPADLYPAQVISNAFPFDEQHYGIVTLGDGAGNGGIVQIISNSAVGNILSINGSIGTVIADNGHANSPGGVFAGIDGPIVAVGLYLPTVSAQIQSVDIGQGILSSGTGTVGFAGIYANGVVGQVANSRPFAEIRGTVESSLELNAIILKNASIINATIDVVSLFNETVQIPVAFATPPYIGTEENPVWQIGQLTVTGDGGIIGAVVRADMIGPTNIASGGYGLFYSEYQNGGDGETDFVNASGYGIRDDLFDGGSSLYGLNATGNGSLVSTDTIDPALFVSRQTTDTLTVFNPFSGLLPSQLDDLDTLLQTGTSDPNIAGRTDTGSIEDTVGVGDRNLGSLAAQTIREVIQVDEEGVPVLPNPTTVGTQIPGTELAFGSEFNFANSIGSVKVRGAIDGLELTSGKIASFNALSIARMGITVSGTIQRMLIRGNYGMPVSNGESQASQVAAGDSFIQAVGPHGVIGNLTITGNLDGTVFAEGSIYALTVYGSVRGNVTSMGESRGLSLGTLHVGAFLDQSSLDITGSVGAIIANGGFGVAGDSLTITGNLGSLQVGALARDTNNSLGMVLTVDGSVGRVNVRGHIDGSIQVGRNLTSLSVTNDGSSTSLINGPINVDGTIGSVSLTNGNAISSITAAGTIGSVSIRDGSLMAGSSFQSASGSIRKFSISGGPAFGLFGSVLAPKGVNENFTISGNVGDGVDPALVTASTGTTFHVVGSIENNATITFTGSLGLLQVDGNIYTGAMISADPLKKQKIKGTNTGSISVI
jgi:hypothetical protein